MSKWVNPQTIKPNTTARPRIKAPATANNECFTTGFIRLTSDRPNAGLASLVIVWSHSFPIVRLTRDLHPHLFDEPLDAAKQRRQSAASRSNSTILYPYALGSRGIMSLESLRVPHSEDSSTAVLNGCLRCAARNICWQCSMNPPNATLELCIIWPVFLEPVWELALHGWLSSRKDLRLRQMLGSTRATRSCY